MVNQQGTLLKDTSETIRIEYLNKAINKAFINWFIGYVEGQENIFIVNRRYLRFELNCTVKNQSIIYSTYMYFSAKIVHQLKAAHYVTISTFIFIMNLATRINYLC